MSEANELVLLKLYFFDKLIFFFDTQTSFLYTFNPSEIFLRNFGCFRAILLSRLNL